MLFVIDTSGSMCVTTAVEGRLSLRGDRIKDMSRLLAAGVSFRFSIHNTHTHTYRILIYSTKGSAATLLSIVDVHAASKFVRLLASITLLSDQDNFDSGTNRASTPPRPAPVLSIHGFSSARLYVRSLLAGGVRSV